MFPFSRFLFVCFIRNKATNSHLGTLKAKLARLRNELFVEQAGGSGGGGGEGFAVSRNGDARVALIGFPSVGKSSLLSELTATGKNVASCIEFLLVCLIGAFFFRFKNPRRPAMNLQR